MEESYMSSKNLKYISDDTSTTKKKTGYIVTVTNIDINRSQRKQTTFYDEFIKCTDPTMTPDTYYKK
eukprot:11986656-Ditylum_brightwellii.AAC.1